MATKSKPVPVRVLKSKKREWDTRPTLYFSCDDLPAIKNWQVGEEYNLTISAKMKSSQLREDKNGKQKLNAEFVVTKIHNE